MHYARLTENSKKSYSFQKKMYAIKKVKICLCNGFNVFLLLFSA